MLTILSALGFGATAGSLLTLLVKARIDRRTERRAERRALYLDLVRVLSSRQDYMRNAIYDQEMSEPDVPSDQVEELNARLLIDASEEIRQHFHACFELLNRFRRSRSFRAPIQLDQHGLYDYQFEQVDGVSEATRHMIMRVALGRVSDEFGAAVDRLVARVRVELHGEKTK